MSRSASPPVALHDVSVAYGNERALESATLTIEAGDFVGIVGPNGSGKTTLLKAMLGLVPTQAGHVVLYGMPLARFRDWPRVGYVPQNASQVEARFPATALEVVLLGRVARRGLFRWLSRSDKEKARKAMEEVGVAHLADRLVGSLSGGQRQRVLLAKALAADPDVLILDEPTTGVDPEARASFYELLDHLNHDHGLTIVLVSHDTEAIARSVHRIVSVNRRIVFDGTPSRFVETEREHAAHFALTHAGDPARQTDIGGH
ncbi:MAG: metal ABC transporter ATP-binding protein [Candidatus Thermoplasmatota archaeon]